MRKSVRGTGLKPIHAEPLMFTTPILKPTCALCPLAVWSGFRSPPAALGDFAERHGMRHPGRSIRPRLLAPALKGDPGRRNGAGLEQVKAAEPHPCISGFPAEAERNRCRLAH